MDHGSVTLPTPAGDQAALNIDYLWQTLTFGMKDSGIETG